jgi:hypothetical protein
MQRSWAQEREGKKRQDSEVFQKEIQVQEFEFITGTFFILFHQSWNTGQNKHETPLLT